MFSTPRSTRIFFLEILRKLDLCLPVYPPGIPGVILSIAFGTLKPHSQTPQSHTFTRSQNITEPQTWRCSEIPHITCFTPESKVQTIWVLQKFLSSSPGLFFDPSRKVDSALSALQSDEFKQMHKIKVEKNVQHSKVQIFSYCKTHIDISELFSTYIIIIPYFQHVKLCLNKVFSRQFSLQVP